LTLIVRNEEENLRPCIQPVAHLFDEIVVVDTGSDDNTRAVATELGARLVEFPWCDDFSAARNEAIAHATGDWIFWLDADDRLDEANIRKLEQLLGRLEPNRAYMMDCASLPKQPVDPIMILPHCRLFPRQPAIRWRRRVHEDIADSVQALGFPLVVTGIRIHHMGYQDAAQVRRKTNRNLRLLRLEYVQNPTDSHTLFYLGMAHLTIGQHDPALTYLLSSLKYAAKEPADWMRWLYNALFDTLLHLGRQEQALALLAEGLSRFPNDPTLATKRAELLANLGDLGSAERTLLELLRAPPLVAIAPGCQSVLDRREARYLLGGIYRLQGRLLDAERVYQELLSQYPDYIRAWIGLGYVYLDQRRLGDMEFVARQMEKCACGEAYATNLRAEVWMARGDMTKARDLLDHSIELFPQMAWSRLLLVDWLCKTNAPVNHCITACRDVLRLDPSNAWVTAKLAELQRPQAQSAASPAWFSMVVG
jgi:tetratricopeptide (TPR) repeat protein